ncbi:hypothetical protein COOONC_08563 [Cooperia oncophora]
MSLRLLTFCLFLVIIPQVLSETLLERLDAKRKHPRHHIVDFNYGSDAIAGPRSVNQVGTFRGRPIISRQNIAFVDNEGVPMALLGSHSKDQ